MSVRTWIAAVVFSIVFNSNSLQAEPQILDKQLADIEKAVEDARQELGVPGAALVLVKDDRIILNKGFGLRDIEKQLPVTPDTLFAIGSCTKALTAMAAVMSAEDGKFSLEDSPKKFLPYFALKDPKADAEVTLRDLLTHRTGLGRFDLPWLTGRLTREEVIKVAGLATPTAALRERFQYQNAMYSAAGEAIAAANRTTWEAMISRRFFKPMGMKSSNTSIREMQRSVDFAAGYNIEGSTPTRVPMRLLDNIAPAGGINSTTSDMSRWLRFLLGRGALDGRRFVSEKGVAEVMTPQITIYGNVSYGLGWNLNKWHGHEVIAHGGGIDGFNSIIALMPDRQIGFVLLTNVTASSLPEMVHEIVWTQLVGKPEASEMPSARQPPTPKPSAPPPPATDRSPEISVEELQDKVIEAAGGKARLQQNSAMRLQYALDFENLGMQGAMTLRMQAPNTMSAHTTLLALGKPVGTLDSLVDGVKGEEVSSFSSKRILSGDALEEIRTPATFNEVLHWETLYKEVRIRERTKLGDEDVYVVVKSLKVGRPIVDYISARTFLLLKRDRVLTIPMTPGLPISETYSDFRTVEGMMVPFQFVTENPFIGRVVAKLEDVLFRGDGQLEAQERPEWGRYFSESGVSGTIVIADKASGITSVYDKERAMKEFTPASTFKIPHTLFALDAGIVQTDAQVFPWDGIRREIESWNRDQTLRTAMKNSVVWVYQPFARQLGEIREREYLQRVGYGNADPSGGIDHFWLDGNLRISAFEQISFLQKLYRNELPFRSEHQWLVKDLMLVETGPDWTLRAKTGWAASTNPQIGWWVGWVERNGQATFFALNIDMSNGLADAPSRQSIVRSILLSTGTLPGEEIQR